MTTCTIQNGRLHWSGRPYDAAPEEPAFQSESRIERTRNTVVLITVFGYILLNWGFQQLRIPPVAAGGVPIGEVVLLLALLTLHPARILSRLNQAIWVLPLGIWWGFGLIRVAYDFSEHGSWALRDASHMLESLFLLVGFAFAASPAALERLFRWLPRLLAAGACLGLLYRYQWDIAALSPTVTGAHGFPVAIFGNMMTMPFLMIMGATYLMLWRGGELLPNLMAALLIGAALVLFQQRTLYLVVGATFAFLIWHRRSLLGNVALIVCLAGMGLAVIALAGLQIQGRLGASFDFDFLVAHLGAIVGKCPPGHVVCQAADGVDLRLGWWDSLFAKLTEDWTTMLMGLGYGITLTPFYGGEIPVREPHNSYISVIARTGLIGAIAWAAMMLLLVRSWLRAYRNAVELDSRDDQNWLVLLMVFFISIWVLSIGEDGFEKPYNAIPFYFLWGIVLRVELHSRSEGQ